MKHKNSPKEPRKVICKSKDGNEIEYESVREAAEKNYRNTSSIYTSIRTGRKDQYGNVWRYA